jgi:cytochrome b
MKGADMPAQDTRARLVWDLPLRLFHWLLATCVAGSWVTHELGTQWFAWHARIGYVTLVLLCFRLAWGFVGPRHARFASFLRGPRATLGYLRGLTEPGADTVGHNPLGGLSVVAMLGLLLLQAVTGLFANDDIFNSGPLYGYVDKALSDGLTGLHKGNFDWLLVLIGLHIGAVCYYQFVRREDLLLPMWTGRKPASRVPPQAEIASQRIWLAIVLAGIAALILWRIIATAPPASMSFY